MKVLSAFTGIGGMDLACEAVGWTIAAQIEVDPFCRRVLASHWPHVKCYEDIRDVDAPRLRGDGFDGFDVLVGGPPCQSFSAAGKREGSRDSRWLWPEFIRLAAATRPAWIVGESPRGLLSIRVGGAKDGPYEFPRIVQAIHDLGYSVGWCCYGAAHVGAPHRRERVFVVARRLAAGAGSAGRLAHPARLGGADEPRQPDAGRPLERPGAGAGGGTGPGGSAARIPGGGRTDAPSAADLRGGAGPAGPVADADPGAGRAQPQGRHDDDRGDAGRQEALGGPAAHGAHGGGPGTAAGDVADADAPRHALGLRLGGDPGPQRAAPGRGGGGPREGPVADAQYARLQGDGLHQGPEAGGARRGPPAGGGDEGGGAVAHPAQQLLDGGGDAGAGRGPEHPDGGGAAGSPVAHPGGVDPAGRGGAADVAGAAREAQGRAQERQRVRDAAAHGGADRGAEDAGAAGTLGHAARLAAGEPHHTDDAGTEGGAARGLPRGAGPRDGGTDGQGLGPVEPALGDRPDGLPAWVAGQHPWPARPGESQKSWESPRLSTGEPERIAKLKALGNACVPAQVLPLLRAIAAAEAERTAPEDP